VRLNDVHGLDELAARTEGPVFAPKDPGGVQEVAAFNTAVLQHPAAVVGAASEHDVRCAVQWAAEHNLPVAVQATGHGLYQPADGGVIVSTRRMNLVEYKPARNTVRVGAGTRWRNVIYATLPFGWAPLSGSSSLVGVVGYTLGGGVGLLSRQFGFAADRVERFSIITADGELRRVDADTAPDLFWAVRGGKGNFGIVTEIEFGLVPVTSVYGATIFFAAESTADVLHAWAEWAPTMPTNTSTSIALLQLPELAELPEPLRGKRLIHLRFSHTGDPDEAETLLAPMLPSGTVVLERRGTMAFGDTDVIHQDPTMPLPLWERSTHVRYLDAEAVDALLAMAGPDSNSRLLKVELRQLGGALHEQATVPNAVTGRDAAYSLFMLGISAPGRRDEMENSGDSILRAIAPWAAPTTLVNFLGTATSPAEVRAVWREPERERLVKIKRTIDPENMFRFGHALV
jgi:FAD binding domain/Berberine and berberine like